MRRRARACALQIVYQLELGRDLSPDMISEPAVRSAMARFWHNFESLAPDDEAFAERLVMGVAHHLAALDQALSRCSRHWRLSRMDKVDLSILRLAAYEMLHCSDVPRSVAINEAIELAKLFSGDESASFVNGLLDQLAQERRHAKGDDRGVGGDQVDEARAGSAAKRSALPLLADEGAAVQSSAEAAANENENDAPRADAHLDAADAPSA